VRCEDRKGLIPSDHSNFHIQPFRQFVWDGVGVRFGAGAADDNFDSITNGIDEAAITGRECDSQQVGFARFTEG